MLGEADWRFVPEHISWASSGSKLNLTAKLLSVSGGDVGVVKALTRRFFACFTHPVFICAHRWVLTDFSIASAAFSD